MKIASKIVELKQTEELSSEFVEHSISSLGLDFFHWAILGVKQDKLLVNVNFVEN